MIMYLTTYTLYPSELKKETVRYNVIEKNNKYYIPEMSDKATNPFYTKKLGENVYFTKSDFKSVAWCLFWDKFFMARIWHKREVSKLAVEKIEAELKRCVKKMTKEFKDTEKYKFILSTKL